MAQRTTSGTAAWGIQGGVSGITGIVTSIEQSEEALLSPEYNEAGAVCKQTKYDEHTTISCTVEVAAGTSMPEKGGQITINGKQGYVVNARLVESNQAYRKIEIQAEFYKNCNSVTND